MRKRTLIFLSCFIPSFIFLYIISDGFMGPGTEDIAIPQISERQAEPIKVNISKDTKDIVLYSDQEIKKFYYAYYEKETGMQGGFLTAEVGYAKDQQNFVLIFPNVEIYPIDKAKKCYEGNKIHIKSRNGEVVIKDQTISHLRLTGEVVLTYSKKDEEKIIARLETESLDASFQTQTAQTDLPFKFQWEENLTLTGEGLKADKDLEQIMALRNVKLVFKGGHTDSSSKKSKEYPPIQACSEGPLKLRHVIKKSTENPKREEKRIRIEMYQGIVVTSRMASLTSDYLAFVILLPAKKDEKMFLEQMEAMGKVHFQDGKSPNQGKCEEYIWKRSINGGENLVMKGSPHIMVKDITDWTILDAKDQEKLKKQKNTVRGLDIACKNTMHLDKLPDGQPNCFREEIILQDDVDILYTPYKGKPVKLNAQWSKIHIREETNDNKIVRNPLRFEAKGDVILTEERVQAKGGELVWEALDHNKSKTTLSKSPVLCIKEVSSEQAMKNFLQDKPSSKKEEDIKKQRISEDIVIQSQSPLVLILCNITDDLREITFQGKDGVRVTRIQENKDIGILSAQEMELIARELPKDGKKSDNNQKDKTEKENWELRSFLASGKPVYSGKDGKGGAETMRYIYTDQSFVLSKSGWVESEDGWVKGDEIRYNQKDDSIIVIGSPSKLGQKDNEATGDRIEYYRKKDIAILYGNPAQVSSQETSSSKGAFSIKAARILYDRKKEEATAEGGVLVETYSKKEGKGGARSDRALYYKKTEKVELFGNPAVVWQEKDELTAPYINFNRKEGKAIANGGVTLKFSPNSKGASTQFSFLPKSINESKKESKEPSKNKSSSSLYTLKAKDASVTFVQIKNKTSLQTKHNTSDKTSSKILWNPNSEDEKLEIQSFEANGQVNISNLDEKQEAQGDRMTYDGQKKIARLYGKPAILTQGTDQLRSCLVEVFQDKEVIVCSGPAELKIHPDQKKSKDIKSFGNQELKEVKEVIINCDGPVGFDIKTNRVTFSMNVKINAGEFSIKCGLLKAILNKEEKSIDSLIGHENVIISSRGQEAWGNQIVWDEKQQKATLSGYPQAKLIGEGFKMWADVVIFDAQTKHFLSQGNPYIERIPD